MREFFLVLFLMATVYKSFILAFGLDFFVDLTVLSLTFFILSSVASNAELKVSRRNLGFFIFVSSFFVYQVFITVISDNHFPNAFFVKIKLLLVLLLFLSVFAFCGMIDQEKFIKWLFYNSALSSILFIFIYPLIYYGGKYANPEFIGVYMHVGFFNGLAILIYFFCLPRGLLERRYFSMTVLFLNFLSLMMTGSRAAMIIVGIFFIIHFLKELLLVKSKKRLLVSFFLLILLAATVVILYINKADVPFVERTVVRLLSLFGSGDNARLSFIEFAMVYPDMTEIFTGIGFASYGPLFAGEDVFAYPHNFLVETLFEGGVLWLGIFMVALVFALYRLLLLPDKGLVVLFIYIILMSLKSYSLVSNRIFFFFFMLGLSNLMYQKYCRARIAGISNGK